MFLKKLFSKSGPQTIPYFDAFFGLAMKLSRSLPIPEWATGTPQNYTPREAVSLDLVRLEFENTTLEWLAESNGEKEVVLSPHIEEPLRKLLAEIGLVKLARKLTIEAYEGRGEDWSPSPKELGAIVSTYLKAWLCNSSPFVLLDLADILTEIGRITEAGEAVHVALKFPSYARIRTMNNMELMALSFANEHFPPGRHHKAHPGLSPGIYSPEALSFLSEEAKAVLERLDGLPAGKR